ncbi:histidine phosphatase family protein, partial [Roseisolibacter sp. H3M3-2]|uniref:histidine phosphatase family protein n=1 Tax=Roseisolibacter sp. H3M3-2 TaxID=3031323 RepID=UPI0023DB1808
DLALAVAAPAARAESATPGGALAGGTLVVLVRHAEKAAVPGDDPPLSEIGTARAEALRAALADAGVRHVVATARRRTSDTAKPLSDALGLTPELVPLQGNHVQAVADAVRRRRGEVVLVVGHSNTIPAIIGALGGPKMRDLCDPQYAQLFVLELPAAGAPRLVRGQFGAADARDAASSAAAPRMR